MKPLPHSISMRKLGEMGRFGNELFQFASLSTCAREQRCEFQHPHWVGEYLFGLKNTPMPDRLAPYKERRLNDDKFSHQLPPIIDELSGHDYIGYCQWHTSWWTAARRAAWFRFLPTTEQSLRMRGIGPSLMTEPNPTWIGIHIRRGDYGQGLPWDKITPVTAYLAWLEEWWPKIERPALFVASEDRALVDEFARYEPQTVESLGVELRAEPYPYYPYLQADLESGDLHTIDFFPEWECLRRCKYLACANSTFSFSAAMASRCLIGFARFDPDTERIEPTDLWNTWPLLRATCKPEPE